jgi:protein TonB
LAIWALASGLAKDIVKKVSGPIDVKVIEEQVKPPPPPEKIIPPPPDLKAPPPPFVPPPEFQVTAPAPPAPPIQSTQVAPPVAEFKPAPAAAPAPAPPSPARTGPVKAGIACPKMVKPEVTISFDSPVLMRALATVKAGRIVDVSVQKISGSADRKAIRAFGASIEAAMKSYECQGTDLQVEQEFQFNPE